MPRPQATEIDAEVIEDLRLFMSLGQWRGPTYREFQAARGLSSSSGAKYRFERLKNAGLIFRFEDDVTARGWGVTAEGEAAAGLEMMRELER